MFLNRLSMLEEIASEGHLHRFRVRRARASAIWLAGGVIAVPACALVSITMHPALLLLLAPIAVGSILLALVLVWSRCTLEIPAKSGLLRLRERILFWNRVKEWRISETQGLVVEGDDPETGYLQIKLAYGYRVSLAGGDRKRILSLAARIRELLEVQADGSLPPPSAEVPHSGG